MQTLDAFGSFLIKFLIPFFFIFVMAGAVTVVLSQIKIDGMDTTGLVSQHSVLAIMAKEIGSFISTAWNGITQGW